MSEPRLQVYMARCGVDSRRRCEQLILQGRVQVNGEVVTRQGVKVREGDRVTLDGEELRPVARLIYLALNKPPNYLCANADPLGRPLACDLFAGEIRTRLFHVGRLDFLSSGLIFYTNDGEFARRVAHPSSGVEKEYQVRTGEPIPEEVLERWSRGLEVEGETYRLERYRRRGEREADLVLREGKNREIRKVLGHFGLTVHRIYRVRIGEVTIRGIEPGRFRHLTPAEIRGFMDSIKE